MKQLLKPLVLIVIVAMVFVWVPAQQGRVHAETWSAFEGSETDGLSADAAQNAYAPYMIEFDGELYATWYEGDYPDTQIRVMKYDDGTAEWVAVDGGSLNQDADEAADYPRLTVFNDELYAAWTETSPAPNAYSRLRVKKYEGDSTWVSVDGGQSQGLNYETQKNAFAPEVIGYGNELYAFWIETNGTQQTVRGKKMTGSGWVSVDGNQTIGLNIGLANPASAIDTVVLGDKLYLALSERNGATTYHHWVKAYDGTDWTLIGGDQSAGLNRDSANNAYASSLAAYDGGLYVTWSEEKTNAPGQIRAMRYEGGTSWSYVDGDDEDAGLNRRTVDSATGPSAVELDGRLYATWLEDDEVRIAAYDGSDWTFVDGDEEDGLNVNALGMDGGAPVLAVHNGKLYASWTEDFSGLMQVRILEMGPDPTASIAFGPEPGATDVETDARLELKFPENADVERINHKYIRLYDENDEIVELYNEDQEEEVDELKVRDLEYDEEDEVYYVYPYYGLDYETTYYVQIDEGAFEVDGIVFAGIDDKTTWRFTTEEPGPPELEYTYPGDDETEVDVETDLSLYFDQEVEAVTGKFIYIKNSDDEIVEQLDVMDSDAVSVDYDEVSVYLTDPLDYNSDYYVEVDDGAFVSAGGEFAGLSGEDSWNFTTRNQPAPLLQHYEPNGTGVSPSADLTLAFDQDVTAQADQYIYIYKADGTLVEQITVDDTSRVTVNGGSVTVNPANNLLSGTSYYVEVDTGAFVGSDSGSEFEGIYGDWYWTFTTKTGLLKGDANGDGLVTPADALIVNKYVQGKIVLTADQLLALDMDEDDDVDAVDAKLILDIYLGKGA